MHIDSTQFTFREEWYDARLAYERFADENTHIPPFVVMATSEQLDLSQQIWVGCTVLTVLHAEIE